MEIPRLGDILQPHARARGAKVALRGEGQEVDYAELEVRARRIANGLISAGIGRGDRIAYLGKNTVSYFEALIGAAKAGAVMVPINWRLAPAEVAALIADCAPRWMLVGPGFEATAAQVAPGIERVECGATMSFAKWRDAQSDADPGLEAAPDDTVLQLYTSGTTGLPKGAELTNAGLFGLRASMNAAATPTWYAWTSTDVSLIAMPAAHISGTGWGLWTMLHGGTGIVSAEFDPHAVFDLMVRHRINKIMMVPTAIQIAIRHPQAQHTDFSFLHCICYGGSPMPPDLLRDAMSVFGCGFAQMYGMTETSGTIVGLPPEDHDPANGGRLGSVGLPLPGVELKVCDASGATLPAGECGEILTRSIANMARYFNRPDETAKTVDADGWLHTGDAGFVDADGYLYLRDRVKDMIITGGENVYPVEVENALRMHPAVADVAVVGVADETWGERVLAAVVLKDNAAVDANAAHTASVDAAAATAASLIEFARTRIARYKCPKQIEFIAALPRNASGKVLRRELRDRFRAKT